MRFVLLGSKMVFVISMFFCVALFPSYLYIQTETESLYACFRDNEENSSEGVGHSMAYNILQESEYIRHIFAEHTNSVLATDVLDALLSVVGEHASVRSFSYVAKTQEVVMEGSAQDREGVVALIEALNASEQFTSVPRITDVLRQESGSLRLRLVFVPTEL